MPVSYADIEAASELLSRRAHRTPLATSHTVDDLTGATVVFKCENMQRGGSFKFRGAFNALCHLSQPQRRTGVLTWSSGNHAQAIALAGRILEIPRMVVMPEDAPPVKMEATRCYGAEVITYDRARQVREELGAQIARERGLAVIPPYDHPHIVAGQGTAAKELLEDAPELDVILAPCGGGGLLAGTAVAAKHLRKQIKVIGVEPAQADDAARSFRAGEIVSVHDPRTIADGARTPSLGNLNFALIRHLVHDIVTVSEESIITATTFLWERLKLVVEPTGALPLAALLDGTLEFPGKRVGVILSGGNVDFPTLTRAMYPHA